MTTSLTPTCVDIDECAYEEPFCGKNSSCQNIENGATCTCHSGFESENGKNCVDIDECLDENSCPGNDEHCENTIGSFECVCDDGFERDENGNCVNIDECLTTQCPDELMTCLDFIGYAECVCPEGYDQESNLLKTFNRYRRKRPKVDASIFDSALSHTRRSDASEKERRK